MSRVGINKGKKSIDWWQNFIVGFFMELSRSHCVVLGHISPWLRGTLTIFARIAVKVPILEWRSWPYWALFTMYTTYPSRPCLSLGLKSTYRMGKSRLSFKSPFLSNWLRRIQSLIGLFDDLSFSHICQREKKIAYKLSKKGLHQL